jgi:hypothetical protein
MIELVQFCWNSVPPARGIAFAAVPRFLLNSHGFVLAVGIAT